MLPGLELELLLNRQPTKPLPGLMAARGSAGQTLQLALRMTAGDSSVFRTVHILLPGLLLRTAPRSFMNTRLPAEIVLVRLNGQYKNINGWSVHIV